MKDDSVLTTIAIQFAIMSLLAFGGANAVIPEIHRQMVEIGGWMSEREFADLFTISQVAPGPNVMIVTLMGYHVAGFAGALVATVAMCGPTAVLAVFFARTWERFREAPWRILVQAALVPVSIGLIASSAIIFVQIADHNFTAVAITVTTAAVCYWTRWNPLWLFAVACLVGFTGLV
jgi:chromate transporter